MNAREIALTMLIEILEDKKYSHVVINQTLGKYSCLEKQDRAFISKLCLGTIEHCITLDYGIEKYSNIKVSKMKPFIRNLLRMSVYQIQYMTKVPVSAACNEAVKLAKKRGFQNLSGFVNGILRNIIRDGKENFFKLPEAITGAKRLSVLYSMPEWIVNQWTDRFGIETVTDILNAIQDEKPTSIRVNLSKISKSDLYHVLKEEGVTVEDNSILPEAMFLSNYDSLDRLKSFREGCFQVQDESSMLIGRIAGVSAGDLVIDVCAAPGGKSLHIADILLTQESNQILQNKQGHVIARDLTERKVELIKQNILRIGYHNISTEVLDALLLREEDIETADIVIADLPCSGMGVIGRKPDIRYKMKPEQQIELASLQRKILTVVSRYVKKGGILIFSTCTISIEENERNFEFIQNELGFHPESFDKLLPEELRTGSATRGYLQLLPGMGKLDGFFISKARKDTLKNN